MQVCSVLHVAHVGVRRVTVVIVHIGHEDVVVVIHLRSHFCRDFLYQEMFSLHIVSNQAIDERDTNGSSFFVNIQTSHLAYLFFSLSVASILSDFRTTLVYQILCLCLICFVPLIPLVSKEASVSRS